MPRVNTAVAAKDYPNEGIKKGDTYFYWANFRSPKQRSLTRPRPSQLTGSAKLSNVYAAQEAMEDGLSTCTTIDDVINTLDEAYSAAENCIEEYEEAIANLEDGFPNGCPAIDETTEAKDNIEAWRDEIDGAKSEVEGLSAADYINEDDRKAEIAEEHGLEPGDALNKAYDEFVATVQSFDDLSESEQEAMLSDAMDHANGISLDL